MSAVGCYTLHMYCDNENPAHRWDEFPHEYTAEEGTTCRLAARRHGWKFKSNGDTL